MKSIPVHRLSALLLIALLCGSSAEAAKRPLTPVVLFPAFHFTQLKVQVKNQTAFPECPASGTFEDWFLNDRTSSFSQVCRDELLTLVYDPDPSLPLRKRFSNQPGVAVWVKRYGSTESAPFYEPLYEFLESAGYERNKNIRVAGYDSRLTPDMDHFVRRTAGLIEETYRANRNTPVHLVAHSNGPLYAQYLLTHVSQAWKDKYIHGFTPIAGNWPGQGLTYAVMFTGLNTTGFTFPTDAANAESSAVMFQSHPSTYMGGADPEVFHDDEVVIESVANQKSYTPEDLAELFQDAGLDLAQELAPHYIGFVEFRDPASFPNVDVYAEKGSGLETAVGVKLPDLTVGQVLDPSAPGVFFTRDGDINQEDITNDSILVWEAMPCFRFELTDNPGVDHFTLPSHPPLLARLLANLKRPKSVCP
jgi:lecithin-cholesterol acyltransferase